MWSRIARVGPYREISFSAFYSITFNIVVRHKRVLMAPFQFRERNKSLTLLFFGTEIFVLLSGFFLVFLNFLLCGTTFSAILAVFSTLKIIEALFRFQPFKIPIS